MQAKGLVQFFGILLLVVCLYQLSFSFFTSRVEKTAENYATSKVANTTNTNVEQKDAEIRKLKRQYLDSVANEKVVNLGLSSMTYQEVKERQLNLGLDLQGGMSVTLQVSLEELIKAMAGNNSKDPGFKKAIERAVELQKNSQDNFVTLFGKAFEETNPGKSLASIFSNAENSEKIKFNSSNAEVLKVLQNEATAAVDRTFKVLRTRIDQFGVSSPNISLQASTGRVVIELPGVDDPERVRKLLQATAKLEFWELLEMNSDLGKMLDEANKSTKIYVDNKEGNVTKKVESATTTTDSTTTAETKDTTTTDVAEKDTTSAEKDTSLDARRKQNPFFAVFQPSQYPGPIVGFINGNDTARFNEYLKAPEIKSAFPNNIAFRFSAKPREGQDGAKSNVFDVYAIKSRFNDELKAPLEGDAVTDARADIDFNQKVVVSMNMNAEGAKKWRKLTSENLKKSVAIVLDNRVYSAPTVQSEIAGGNSQISGNFTQQEAQDLANILKAGKLSAPAHIVEEGVVGPSLGAESIRSGLLSLLFALLAVIGFVIFYYNSAGLVAVIALIVNLFFILGVLASIGATLTLPGMAGIILTMGIAIDANVIIFERIREELRKGTSYKTAIIDGYSKALSAIIDGNVSTLITAFVLYKVGTGPVLGFATVLIVGILSSLFTAILLTRLMIDWRTNKNHELKFSTGITDKLLRGANYDFIGKRKIAYIFSAILIGAGLISMLTRGFDYGVDFEGGRTYVVRFKDPVSTEQVRIALKPAFNNQEPVVRSYGDSRQVKVTTTYLINEAGNTADSIVSRKLYDGLKTIEPNSTYESFIANNIKSSQKVEPTIADDIKNSAVIATILALIGIFIYILIRFRKWQFALGTVAATAHDALIMLSLYSLLKGILPFSLEVNQDFVAAFLTIIGYSINDTVVVFDRIREYLGMNRNETREQTFNAAINDTLSRTIMTSFITFMVVTVLFIFGGEVIRGFAFALMIGILFGTYSSIFIASSLVIDLPDSKPITFDNILEHETPNTKTKAKLANSKK